MTKNIDKKEIATKVLEPCVLQLENIANKKFLDELVDSSINFTLSLRELGTELATFFRRIKVVASNPNLLQEVAVNLSKGKVSEEIDPIILIRSIADSNPSLEPNRKKIAAIITLYNHYTSIYS